MKINITKDYEEVDCCGCGIVFMIGLEYQKTLRENKKTFYCPNGHTLSYVKSLSQILKDTVVEKEKTILNLYEEIRILKKEVSKKAKPKKK